MKNLLLTLSCSVLLLAAKAQCPISATGNTSITCGQTTTLTASGATSYTWFPGGMTGSSIVVSPGMTTTYQVAGTTGGCNDSTTITVVVTSTVSVSITASNYTVCYGQPVTLTASGATSYTWLPGSITSPTATVYPYAAITYTLLGDNGGCVGSQTASLYGTLLYSNITYTNAGCNGTCNGAMSVNVGGGAPPYTYQWNTGSAAPFVQNVCAGNYACTATDANGCSGMDSVYIGGNNLILFTSSIPAACGQSNGSITIDSVQTSANLKYNLNGGAYSTNNVFSGLTAGIYTVGAYDQTFGCTGTTVVALSNSNFSIQFTSSNPTCNQCDGALSSAITGGTGPYSYSWSNGATTASVSALCAGSYQLSVTDIYGCFSSSTVTLLTPNAPVISVDTVVHVTCLGVTSGSASVSVTGGTAPYTYAWNTAPPQSSPNVTNLIPGYYLITVTDNAGCSNGQWVYVANNNNIGIYASTVQPANCTNNGSIQILTAGGTAPYTYAWSNGGTATALTGLASGTYYVTITDALGCTGAGSVSVGFQCMNVIAGKIYNDLNQNCIPDVGEYGMANSIIQCNNGTSFAYTDNTGNFLLYASALSNTLAVIPAAPYFSPSCTGPLTATLSNMGDTINGFDIGMWSNPNYIDLSIHPGWVSANPGMPKNYWCFFRNNSLNPQNVMVRMTYDPALQYVSCNSGGVHYPSQHQIEWTFNNVQANKQWDSYNDPRANFNVPSSVPITANLNTKFEIFPITGDANPSDNVLNVSEPVTGSRDPNEKTVYPSGNITPSDSVLMYFVHFQNNGNDTAYRVVVIDTLSPFLDPATIIPGAANHVYKFDLKGQGICTWTFDSIMLPDSLTNEPASNGYFNFSVKVKPGIPMGSVIKNTADIYFDYNSAVLTNTTMNTMVAVGAQENTLTRTSGNLLLYPNPAQDKVMVKFDANASGVITIDVKNILGATVHSQTLHVMKGEQVGEINTCSLSSGVYLVQLRQGSQQQTQKLVIQR